MKIIAFFICFFAISNTFFGQLVLENNIRTGYVVNNYVRYLDFPKTKPFVINELKIGVKTYGKKNWHQVYNYPEISLNFLSGNLGNDKQFGYIFSVIPTISFDLKQKIQNIWQMSFGWGVSYFTTPYDSINNEHNILVGYKFAHTVHMSLFYRKQIVKNLFLQVGGAYIHSSNGHFQAPNGGLNLASISFGIKKYFSPKLIENRLKPNYSRKTDINISYDRGIHEFTGSLYPTGTKKYRVYALGVFLGKNFNAWSKGFIGIYGKYYEAFYDKILTFSLYSQNTKLKASVISFVIGAEIKFGHFAVFSFGGLNFYKPFVTDYVYPNIFEYNIDNILELYISSNLGMKYYLLNPEKNKLNIFVAWAVKANFGNADYTYISTGITF